jgi:hypothetical protein
MAQQITNTFLKSKMNKDLDDRILPNGEYRDARNISVGRSEDNDVGALENIIGNNLVTGTNIGDGLTIIGIHSNNTTDQIFVFLTDYTDLNPFQPTDAPSTSKHYIYLYNNSTGTYTPLVVGTFLNFSTTNRIIGINLIENLLFWTDNRNQPRKINIGISNASSGGRATTAQYYTQEHQISVAKYNPYQAIELYTSIIVDSGINTVSYVAVAGDRVTELTPFIGATVVSAENGISGNEFHKITGLGLQAGNVTRIAVQPDFTTAPTTGTYFTFIKSTMTNKNSDATWPGDPDYLEDKFVRFSYRFKYDDNEYSLMAPFTQIAYIPKQNGFFINGDEDSAYQSTIVDFMENLVQNIDLVIPLPTNANRIVRDYKIAELEILFRESDQVAIKVLESISAGEISGASGINNHYTYEYQSRKPYRTLPEAQTIRVYDRVPVRAFSQESSGNRIIYGNYRDQHTPPANINYNCRISPKSDTGTFNNWIEYPNHSVKRNRNYQVGFILADKFGRQSPVILSSVDNGANNEGQFYFGSTIYSPYDISATDTDVISWFGDAINVLVNSEIKSTKNLSSGTPGLYAIEQQEGAIGTGIGFAITGAGISITDTTYIFRLSTSFPNNDNVPRVGDSMRGAYEDFVKVTAITGPSGPLQYTVTTSGRVNDVYLRADNLPVSTPDLKFAYTINDLGWYSYKIVVKQTEQEYYNVYLPGILNDYPDQIIGGSNNDPVGEYNGVFPTGELNLTAFTTLFNDNINKIPRDLAEVGPEQKQFRSSVTLYGRVTNIMTVGSPGNKQYYARLSSQGKNAIAHTSTAIADAKEVNMATNDLVMPSTGLSPFYQLETNPLIARISTTEKPIGTIWESLGNYMKPFLSIYETEPVESLLDIYWETASEGLIVDLNADVLSGAGGATAFANLTWDFDETTLANDFVTTSFFEPLNGEGNPYGVAGEAELISQVDGNGVPVELFSLFSGSGSFAGKYKIRFLGDNEGESLVFGDVSRQIDVYTFVIRVTTSDSDITEIRVGGNEGGIGALKNIDPSFTKIDDFLTTKDTRIIIPAITGTGLWATANPLNGSANIPNKRLELQYTLNRDSATSNIPTNWTMNPINGELTQNVNENPNGTYTATIRVTDANGDSSPNGSGTDYNQKFVEKDTNITIGYARVNNDALSTICTLNPSNGDAKTISVSSNGSSVTGVWYLTENTQNLNLGEISDNTLNKFPINSADGSHKAGTLVISSNVKQIEDSSTGKSFKAGKTTFYYRFFGNTDWIEVPRSLEYNNAGLGNNTTSVLNDAPGGSNGLTLSNGNVDSDTWLSNIRAFDYLDFTANGLGIEYAIVVEDLTKVSGGNGNPVIGWVITDDLHFPQCIPWQGENAAPAVPGSSYEYYRSVEGNLRISIDGIPTSNSIFAETPYGEYVNQFYTDTARTIAYLPSSATPYINFQLKPDTDTPPWTKIGGQSLELSWSAGFGSEDGGRLIYGASNAGVNSVQTTADINDTLGIFATSRIKTDS